MSGNTAPQSNTATTAGNAATTTGNAGTTAGNAVTIAGTIPGTSQSNIRRPATVILADPLHVRLNVENFQDTRTMTKVIANYCKVDAANIISAINRTDLAAQKANYRQNLRANLTAQ